jgi:predicted nucleic acid-binding protein
VAWLLDTNVVSELRRRTPAPAVLRWYESARADSLYLSVLTIGEIHQGVLRLRPRDPRKAAAIAGWLDEVVASYAGHVLPVSEQVARRWAELNSARPLPVVDSLLAATASVHDLTFVTRNTADVAGTGVPVLDPFA